MTAISTLTVSSRSTAGLSARSSGRPIPEHSRWSGPSALAYGGNTKFSAPRTFQRLDEKEALADDGETVETMATTILHAPVEDIDLVKWFYGSIERDRRLVLDAFPEWIAAPDGKRMSIQVEVIGGRLVMQYYVETTARKDNLVLESHSHVIMSRGQLASMHIRWEVSVAALDGGKSKLTNHVQSRASQAFVAFLDRQGIEIETYRSQRLPTPELGALATSIGHAAVGY